MVVLNSMSLDEGGYVSERLRLAGFLCGIGEALGSSISCRVVNAGSFREENGFMTMKKLLEEMEWKPDAVYCSGDLLALGAIKALLEHGLEIPEQVSVVGGAGIDLSETDYPKMTRMVQPLEKLGEALAQGLVNRLLMDESHPVPLPGKILPLPFCGGATTRPQETACLKN